MTCNFNKISQNAKAHVFVEEMEKGKEKDETFLGSTIREKFCPFMKYKFPCLSCVMVC